MVKYKKYFVYLLFSLIILLLFAFSSVLLAKPGIMNASYIGTSIRPGPNYFRIILVLLFLTFLIEIFVAYKLEKSLKKAVSVLKVSLEFSFVAIIVLFAFLNMFGRIINDMSQKRIEEEQKIFLNKHSDVRLKDIKYKIKPRVSEFSAIFVSSNPGVYQLNYVLTDKDGGVLIDKASTIEKNNGEDMIFSETGAGETQLLIKRNKVLKTFFIRYTINKQVGNVFKNVYSSDSLEEVEIINEL